MAQAGLFYQYVCLFSDVHNSLENPQIGSLVPASYASTRIHDALLSRLSNDDSIESGLSTFAKEMRQMSLIISALPSFNKCLVIIDELGRGTAPHEGIGIAHALAERVSCP
jgi:DNA mismatch repair protein MSH4